MKRLRLGGGGRGRVGSSEWGLCNRVETTRQSALSSPKGIAFSGQILAMPVRFEWNSNVASSINPTPTSSVQMVEFLHPLTPEIRSVIIRPFQANDSLYIGIDDQWIPLVLSFFALLEIAKRLPT